MTTTDAPVTVEQACERIQRWMDDEHRELSPGEVGAELVYDDVSIVLRAARLAALASAPAGDDWRLVPILPTQEMLDAGGGMIPGTDPDPTAAGIVWTFMLAAAPAALARPRAAVGEDFLSQLRRVNTDRYHAWVGDGQDAGMLFDAAELGGEVGELLNVVKKLEREDRGWRGSRAAPRDFADECADVLICLDKLARRKGVDLAAATVAKFNATSEKVDLPHRLALQSPPAKVE